MPFYNRATYLRSSLLSSSLLRLCFLSLDLLLLLVLLFELLCRSLDLDLLLPMSTADPTEAFDRFMRYVQTQVWPMNTTFTCFDKKKRALGPKGREAVTQRQLGTPRYRQHMKPSSRYCSCCSAAAPCITLSLCIAFSGAGLWQL